MLFLIIFFWTPPHFWALSLYRAEDYARAGIPMLPVVSGEAETRRQILLYSLVLAPLGASPWLLGYAGALYGIVAVAAGAAMVALAMRIHRDRAAASEEGAQADVSRPAAIPPASRCSPSRSSTCFCCLPCCWSIGSPVGCSAILPHDNEW